MSKLVNSNTCPRPTAPGDAGGGGGELAGEAGGLAAGEVVAQVADEGAARAWGRTRLVTSQHSWYKAGINLVSTTLYQASYHIQSLLF